VIGTDAELFANVLDRGGKMVALKTGMGSSAALVTSLVAALVAFFVPTVDFDKRAEDLELVHNLAQLSHCYVQRKVRTRSPSIDIVSILS
jgi:phosphomevalonate kinase